MRPPDARLPFLRGLEIIDKRLQEQGRSTAPRGTAPDLQISWYEE